MFAKRKESRKGVYGVVEEVMLFGIGVVIMAGIVAIFDSLEDEMLSTLGNDQLVALNKYVASTAIMLYEINCTSCYVDFELPPSMGGEPYTVGGSVQKKIMVYSPDEKMIEEDIPVPAEGSVKSTYSYLRIQYENSPGKINLYGVTNY